MSFCIIRGFVRVGKKQHLLSMLLPRLSISIKRNLLSLWMKWKRREWQLPFQLIFELLWKQVQHHLHPVPEQLNSEVQEVYLFEKSLTSRMQFTEWKKNELVTVKVVISVV